jgi:hypothetical protein
VGDTLAQALALLEEGKDREAEALLLAPQEGPLEAERLGEDLEVWEALLERLPPKTPASPSPGPGWRGSAGSTGCRGRGDAVGVPAGQSGPGRPGQEEKPKNLAPMPPGCHERGYAGGQMWNPFHVTSA